MKTGCWRYSEVLSNSVPTKVPSQSSGGGEAMIESWGGEGRGGEGSINLLDNDHGRVAYLHFSGAPKHPQEVVEVI